MLGLDIVLYFNCLFICWKSQNWVSFWNVAVQCIVLFEHSSLHWEGSGALAASFPLLIGPPSLHHHLVLHHPPVLHHHLVGFKCTSQDFVGRTVVFSEKWKAKQYQMTSHCHISTFFSMTLSKDHHRTPANCTFDAKIGKVRKQLQLLSSGATSHLSSHGRVTACQPCLATGDFDIIQWHFCSKQSQKDQTKETEQKLQLSSW